MTLILVIIVLIGNVNSKVIMPWMMACLGIFQIFNGLYFYEDNKKIDGTLSILVGIFIFGILIKGILMMF